MSRAIVAAAFAAGPPPATVIDRANVFCPRAGAPPTPNTMSRTARPTQQPATSNVDKEAVERCKKKYRDQIDAIDAQMRSGYTSEQGEAFRKRLRGLTEKLRAC